VTHQLAYKPSTESIAVENELHIISGKVAADPASDWPGGAWTTLGGSFKRAHHGLALAGDGADGCSTP
jgi:hypothetical protein